MKLQFWSSLMEGELWKSSSKRVPSLTYIYSLCFHQKDICTTKNGAWSCVLELRLTKTQLQSRVWAAFYTNAAPPSCLSCVFTKRSSTSAKAVFEMVQAAALGYIEKQKKKKKKRKKGLEIGAAFIKRGSNFYRAAFNKTQLQFIWSYVLWNAALSLV